jgi:hypothetical protein
MTLPPLRLRHALRLRCLHCGETPLLRPGSWFQLREGCPRCNYLYEREPGYFTGASWVLTYTAGALAGIAAGAVLLWRLPELSSTTVSFAAAAAAALTAFGFMPFGKALWLYLDHFLHPLEQQEAWRR